METANTTKTDKQGFKVDIIDTNRYSKLSPELAKLFIIQRNQLLELMVPIDGKYADMMLQVAENFAFVGIAQFESMQTTIDALVKRVETLELSAATVPAAPKTI